MKSVAEIFGIETITEDFYKHALTHSSYTKEHDLPETQCYERLEFLGDAVLSIVVSDYIFENCPKLPEGELTKLRASLVCEKSLHKFAKEIDLGKHLFLSHGEKRSGGALRASILSTLTT